FTAAHSFAKPGSYSVTLTVTDHDGGQDRVALTVVVQSPADAMAIVNNQVQGLTRLNSGQRNALSASLTNAIASMARGNTTAAKNQLKAFINKLKAHAKSGQLTQAQADLLISETIAIIGALT